MIVRRKLIVAASMLVLGLSACAGTPPAPTSTGTGTAAVAPADAAAQSARQKAESPFPGYSARKTRNGQMLYCREDNVAGTRIPKLVCASEDTLRNQTAEAKKQVDDIRETAGRGGCNPSDPIGC